MTQKHTIYGFRLVFEAYKSHKLWRKHTIYGFRLMFEVSYLKF